RVGERHADLDEVGAGGGDALEEPRRGLEVGVAGGQIGAKSGAPFRLQRGETLFDAAHSVTPRCSATAKMSLSPRPHMFITRRWSRGRLGAIFATCASACAGSSAGMMPSSLLHSWNASSASRSVIETYSTRPRSCSQECSGPMPG